MCIRDRTGRNRSFGTDTITGRFTDWLTNSVGAIMFFNTRSAVLQTISAVNFINFSDNNPLKAGQAFANQPQYWKDFMTLMNSDFLVDRRNGLRLNVNENDIADISLNDTALIQVDAYQNKKFKGIVKEVAYAATTSSGGSSQQVTNFQVKVQMLEVVDGMRPGMSATVDIITEERLGAIAIPIQALTTPRPGKSAEKKSGFSAEVSVNGESQWSNRKQFGGKQKKSTVVFVLKDDNTVEQRIVEAGIVGDRDYEIISGLEVDETIVTGSFIAISRELYDGAVVKVKENSRPSRKRG